MNNDSTLITDEERVGFYERDHYYLSNFSAFSVSWRGVLWTTSEHAYQAAKFPPDSVIYDAIRLARSAHDAFKIAEANAKLATNVNWGRDGTTFKLRTMKEILRAKADQHEYVRRKLLATGDRELVEDSWRDAFWGWGEKQDGDNALGKLWMEVRAELRGIAKNADSKEARQDV